MKTNQKNNDLYRSPIFRRISEPHGVGKKLTHTGLVMEWWERGRLCFVDVLHDYQLQGKISNFYHQTVFPAEQVPMTVNVPEYSVVDENGTTYLPLDILLRALFESGHANRPFMEVIREFPHPVQTLPKRHAAPQRGNLIDQLEDEGFELYLCDAAVKAGDKFIQQIMWWANPQCPIQAAEILVGFEPKLNAEWILLPDITNLAPQFTKELKKRYPDPLKMLRPAAIEQIRHLAETYQE